MPDDRADGSRRHVLALNNDAMVLALFRDLLEDEGYRVSTQTYLDKDLAGIVALAPDLIILDYMWSSDDQGWSYLQMLRMDPQTAKLPIVLCTAAVREVEALEAHLAEMAVRVVLKPFHIDQLLDAVRGALSDPPPG
ncbi:MAG TPA: response regulator [Thermomicrobiales bacterium]|jgi:CheY-like chemotaxis protein|nr:response regulator [Thermomicrobiales bacterium]